MVENNEMSSNIDINITITKLEEFLYLIRYYLVRRW